MQKRSPYLQLSLSAYPKIGVKLWLTSSLALFYWGCGGEARSQIVPDGTLSTNVRTPDNLNFTIEDGNRAGNNLFHSFREFSIPTGGEAFFNNAVDIQNIFSRVTGNSISNLDGSIRANGIANLFLINPNGIIFGKNARLHIGGSFLGSVANSIKFADGIEFSASNPQTSPILSINVPQGLQLGTNPGQIVVIGSGHNISQDPNPPRDIIRDNRPGGLQVNDGQTLAIVGGEVVLQGGNITAEQGRIELGSVDAGSYVTITNANPGWLLGYENVQNFQDINLIEASSIDVSGAGSGNIQVQGRRLRLSEGSVILGLKTGSTFAGTLTVKTTDAIEAIGTTKSENIIPSGLFALVSGKGTGTGGNIRIETGQLIIEDGAQIGASTLSGGQGGTLTVKASQSVEISGTQTDPKYPSGLLTGV